MRLAAYTFVFFAFSLDVAVFAAPQVYLKLLKQCKEMQKHVFFESMQRARRIMEETLKSSASYEQYRADTPLFLIPNMTEFCPQKGERCMTLLQLFMDFIILILRLELYLKRPSGDRSVENDLLRSLGKLREAQLQMREGSLMNFRELKPISLSIQLHQLRLKLYHQLISLHTSPGHSDLIMVLNDRYKDLQLGKLEHSCFWNVVTFYEELLGEHSHQAAFAPLSIKFVPASRYKSPDPSIDFRSAYRSYIWGYARSYAELLGTPFPLNLGVSAEGKFTKDLELVRVSHQELHLSVLVVAINVLALLDAIPPETNWSLRQHLAQLLDTLEVSCKRDGAALYASRILITSVMHQGVQFHFFSIKSNPKRPPQCYPRVFTSAEGELAAIIFYVSDCLSTDLVKEWARNIEKKPRISLKPVNFNEFTTAMPPNLFKRFTQ